MAHSGWILAALLLFPTIGAASEESVAFLAHSGNYWQVWVMRPDGTDARQITRSSTEKASVSWYPDGRYLLVTEIPERLVRVDLEGHEVGLDVGVGGIHDAAVSPDGEWLALSANPGEVLDRHDIWLARVDGKEPRPLVAIAGLQHEPRWSADGAWIYFLSGSGQQDHDIWRARVDSGATEQLTVGERYHFEIDVSRAGALAYSSNRMGDYEIYSLASGSKPVRWTDSVGLDGHPTWSPRGDALIFHSMRGGKLNLWRQDGPSQAARAITRFPDGARSPEWWSRE